MWGKKRGEVLINRETNFGNVLPKSIRKFEFSWSGDSSLFDIGQYSAVATLNFGEGQKQNISATAYFWVVPVVPVAATLTSVVGFVFLLIWFIRRYIRRALDIERARHHVALVEPNEKALELTAVPETYSLSTLIEPVRQGVIDLRRVSTTPKIMPAPLSHESVVSEAKEVTLTYSELFKKYRLFVLFIVVLIAATSGTYEFFTRVLVPERGYEIKAVQIQTETAK